MEESLALFRVILPSDYFCNASVISFPEHLTSKHIQYIYPDFKGDFAIELIDYDLFQYSFSLRDL
jgi:hypothetical protein